MNAPAKRSLASRTLRRFRKWLPEEQIFPAEIFWAAGRELSAKATDIQVQAYYDRTNRHEPNFGDIRNTFDVDFLQRFYIGPRNHFSWGLGLRASHGR